MKKFETLSEKELLEYILTMQIQQERRLARIEEELYDNNNDYFLNKRSKKLDSNIRDFIQIHREIISTWNELSNSNEEGIKLSNVGV